MVNKLSDHIQATLSFYVIGSFIGLVLLVLIINAFKKSTKVIKSIQYLSLLHIIFWVIHHLIWVFVYTRYALKGWILKSKEPILWYTYICCLNLTTVLAQCSMFTIMLARLYYTFKRSVYELSDFMIIMFLILIFIASCMLLIGLWMNNGIFEEISEETEEHGFKVYISGSSLFAIIGFLLIYLFAKKLVLLIMFTSANKTQSRLFKLAIKSSLLSFIAIMSFNAYLVTLVLLKLEVIVLDPWNDKDAWTWLYIVKFNQVITVGIEMICMYLSLGSASKLYNKCCKPCHYVCKLFIVKLVRICCQNVNIINDDELLLSVSDTNTIKSDNIALTRVPSSTEMTTYTDKTTE